jgi:HAE1 family hydrophobic/amphiphilic exporter-1
MTVSFAVLISLFVSFTLTPMLASRFITPTKSRFWLYIFIEKALKGLDNGYRELLRRALKYKLATVLVAVAIFIFSLFIGSRLPMEFQPNMDQAKFNVSVLTPPGSPIALMEKKIAEVETIVRQIDGVNSTFSTVGTGSVETVTEGSILVNLVPKSERKNSQTGIANLARQQLTNIYGAKVKVSAGETHGFRSADIQVSIQSDDINQLISIADNITARLKNEPGFVDVDTSYESGKPEVKVVLDRDRASELGLSVMGVASTVNGLVSGETVVTSFKEAGKDYDVKVRLKPELRDDPMDLLALPVRSMSGELLDLGSVAQIQSGSGPSEINHYNRQRTVSVYSNLAGVPLGTAKAKMEEILKADLPPGVTYTFVGLAEIMAESFQSLFFSMGLAVILIYMLLASQFENFLHPLAIMFSLPLSLIGALGGLFLTGMSISMLTLIGIIMLMGLVTKNAILLVDYTNTLRRRGLERQEALLQAGPVRLRPILMTTSAMVFGMLPVALATASGSEIQAPMAICVIGGLITSMLLTLIVVPVVYSIFDSWVERISGKRKSDSE